MKTILTYVPHDDSVMIHRNKMLYYITAGAQVVSQGGRVTGHAGLQATLKCEARGDLPLKLQWTRDDRAVTTSGRLILFYISYKARYVGNIPFRRVYFILLKTRCWDC